MRKLYDDALAEWRETNGDHGEITNGRQLRRFPTSAKLRSGWLRVVRLPSFETRPLRRTENYQIEMVRESLLDQRDEDGSGPRHSRT